MSCGITGSAYSSDGGISHVPYRHFDIAVGERPIPRSDRESIE
jgi:hypothetical protein